jgi:hypothetical protein
MKQIKPFLDFTGQIEKLRVRICLIDNPASAAPFFPMSAPLRLLRLNCPLRRFRLY